MAVQAVLVCLNMNYWFVLECTVMCTVLARNFSQPAKLEIYDPAH